MLPLQRVCRSVSAALGPLDLVLSAVFLSVLLQLPLHLAKQVDAPVVGVARQPSEPGPRSFRQGSRETAQGEMGGFALGTSGEIVLLST